MKESLRLPLPIALDAMGGEHAPEDNVRVRRRSRGERDKALDQARRKARQRARHAQRDALVAERRRARADAGDDFDEEAFDQDIGSGGSDSDREGETTESDAVHDPHSTSKKSQKIFTEKECIS